MDGSSQVPDIHEWSCMSGSRDVATANYIFYGVYAFKFHIYDIICFPH